MRKTCLIVAAMMIWVSASTQGDKRCDFVTDGTGASHGTKVKMVYPCNFEDSGPQDDETVLKQVKTMSQGSLVMIRLQIEPVGKKMSKAQAEAKYSAAAITRMYQKKGRTVTNAVGMHKRPNGDLMAYVYYHYTERDEENNQTFFSYNLDHLYFNKGNLVTIGYEALGLNEHNAKHTLGNYDMMIFRTLWPKTSFFD